MEASIIDLRRKMPEVLAAVERHEHVIITYHGKRKAVLIPYVEKKPETVSVADCTAFGMWKNRDDMENVEEYVNNLRADRRF